MTDLPLTLAIAPNALGDRQEVLRALARVLISVDRRRREGDNPQGSPADGGGECIHPSPRWQRGAYL
ncbi:MAG: hypothetical protein ACYTG0_32000 [Planctomycetota bacterium]